VNGTRTSKTETEPTLLHVAYVDGSYGECYGFDADDALEILSHSVEMATGPVAGSAPSGATVTISTFGSER
jgi:hypothetical protein